MILLGIKLQCQQDSVSGTVLITQTCFWEKSKKYWPQQVSEFPSLERSSAMPVKTTYLNVLKPLKTVYFIKINKRRYTQKQVIHFLEEKRHFSLCQDNSHLAHSASDSQHTGTSEVEPQTYLIPALAFSSATLKTLSYTQLLPKLII